MSDHEPVFKRSPWGTSRYVYNPNNPVGLALIVISVLVGGIVMLMLATRSGPFAVDDPPAHTPAPSRTDLYQFLPSYPATPYRPTVVPPTRG